MTDKPERGRLAEAHRAELIPDTPGLVTTPPQDKDEWRYLQDGED